MIEPVADEASHLRALRRIEELWHAIQTLDTSKFDPNPISGTQVHEYLSLTNTNSIAIDLTGWKLEGGVDHSFIPGTVIPSKGILYLSPDRILLAE